MFDERWNDGKNYGRCCDGFNDERWNRECCCRERCGCSQYDGWNRSVDASISQFVHAITANIVILIAAATGEIAVMSMEDVIAETIALRITGISVITAMTTNYENFLIVYIQNHLRYFYF